ncbi:MAG: pilin [Candidatus Parcubacteria bacterium]|nr:pilin [Candidatus Parcubacteria bacterium]
MKKFLIIILIFTFLMPLPLLAADKFQEGLTSTGTAVYGTNTPATPIVYIANLIKALMMLLGIVFVGLLIYGGFFYLTSLGNPEKAGKGKNTIVAAVVGLLIIFSGYTVTYFLTSQVESPGKTTGQPAFNASCEGGTNQSTYRSESCCEYRFQRYSQIEAFCCESYPTYCSSHDCATAGYTCS